MLFELVFYFFKNFIFIFQQINKLYQKAIRGFSLKFGFEIKQTRESKTYFNYILKLLKVDFNYNQNPLITQWQDTLINIPFANIEEFGLSYFAGFYTIGVRNVQIFIKFKVYPL